MKSNTLWDDMTDGQLARLVEQLERLARWFEDGREIEEKLRSTIPDITMTAEWTNLNRQTSMHLMVNGARFWSELAKSVQSELDYRGEKRAKQARDILEARGEK